MKLAQVLLTSLFVILLVSPSLTARVLPRYQVPSLETQEDDIFHELMGWEECNDRDEECLKRRMVSEAHLDYIYTQHHKPKP